MTRKKRPPARRQKQPLGYWNDPANLERELRAFAAARGEPGRMPSQKELIETGRWDLWGAISGRGGLHAIAEQFGLDASRIRRPRGYWHDWDNFRRELLAFIAEHGQPGVAPHFKELERARRSDLAGAMALHGGLFVVARRLRLKVRVRQRPRGYWSDPANLKRELHAFIREHGRLGMMPTEAELHAVGRFDLASAIGMHGGCAAVAARYGLKTHRRRFHL